MVEIKRTPEQTEALLWFCERCQAQLHAVTMHVSDIETELKAAIGAFDARVELRTYRQCGCVHPEKAEIPHTPSSVGRAGMVGTDAAPST